MDIIISLLAIIVFFIPVLFLSILIMVESPGSPIYSQKRVLAHKRNLIKDIDQPQYEEFSMYKLRTMVKDAELECGAIHSPENDPRITRIGKILRKTRLDELPNFINVFLGHMSVVGPRACRISDIDQVKDEFPILHERHRHVKPGITGLSQLRLKSNGDITENSLDLLNVISKSDVNKDIKSYRFKMYYDGIYLIKLTRFWSFIRTDISIIIKTPLVMFLRSNVI
jgi:lipopolysaccharide/colanic/teichoic acid biosynthesis glycosyltransferase